VEGIQRLEGHTVKNPRVSLSLTFSRNENVEKHMRKKTHKHIVLMFWIEGDVRSLI